MFFQFFIGLANALITYTCKKGSNDKFFLEIHSRNLITLKDFITDKESASRFHLIHIDQVMKTHQAYLFSLKEAKSNTKFCWLISKRDEGEDKFIFRNVPHTEETKGLVDLCLKRGYSLSLNRVVEGKEVEDEEYETVVYNIKEEMKKNRKITSESTEQTEYKSDYSETSVEKLQVKPATTEGKHPTSLKKTKKEKHLEQTTQTLDEEIKIVQDKIVDGLDLLKKLLQKMPYEKIIRREFTLSGELQDKKTFLEQLIKHYTSLCDLNGMLRWYEEEEEILE
ncbi:hypothetical protein EHP00_1718 [Ecytonucleospora hepatopenaei]|uniref:Uncharacterized protein n=1 Tax=Ecytonucleospora hepatopenaei TaxID=646526 RepID=A0A1W0E6A8_9MICR|nr:hypothetical protein EHP00_1718 [Ecytonucleospora hepatopenaei]